jgi:hypothetical protein
MKRILLYSVVITAAVLFCGSMLAFAQQPASTEVIGGRGGNAFSDSQPATGARVMEVRIRSGERVDSVQMVYALQDGRTVVGSRHGGGSGQLHSILLDADEYITGLAGRYGEMIDSLRIITNKRESLPFGGLGGSRNFRIDVPYQNQAVGFAGRAGIYLDAIGLTYSPITLSRRRGVFTQIPTQLAQISQTSLAGGRGGSEFADRDIPSGASIVEVNVWAGERIDAVQMVYMLPDGRSQEGARHGGTGGNAVTFRLDPDEYITGISGRSGEMVDSLRIITNKRTSQVFGGRGGDRDFRIDIPRGNLAVGFAGRSGNLIDAIGLTYTAAASARRLPDAR